MAARILAGCSYGSEEVNISALLAFLKENKYPLIHLNHNNVSQWFYDLPEFKAARETERNLLSSLKAEYVTVRKQWARAGIPCILIKSGGSTPSFPYTSENLDVLVKEEHEEAARTILREQGYVELRNIEEPKKFLFRKFAGGECVSAIHLHTQVGWEVGFMDEESLWERAGVAPDDEDITVPSPEDVILITAAHSFYENKQFCLADIAKIRSCWQHVTIDWGYVEDIANKRGWLDGLHFCILLCDHVEKALWNDSSIPAAVINTCLNSPGHDPVISRYYRGLTRRSPISLPFSVSFFFSKYLYYKKVLRDRNRKPGHRLPDVLHTLFSGVKLKLNIRSQPSLLVSFSGPDGSGKTQHARTLIKSLKSCGIKTRYYWSRAATSGLFRIFNIYVKATLRHRSEAKEGQTGVARRRQRLRNPLLRFLWCYLAAADMVLSYFFQVRLPILRGKVVVCDRYVFDAAAEMECSLLPDDRLNRLAIKLMLALVPKPDAAYFLDIPEDVCAQRKDEDIDADYLRRQRKVYIELVNRYHLRIKKTDRDFNATADEISGEVLTSYFDNFRTFLNSLFLSNPGQLNPRRRGVK
jgi:dTMP kinase